MRACYIPESLLSGHERCFVLHSSRFSTRARARWKPGRMRADEGGWGDNLGPSVAPGSGAAPHTVLVPALLGCSGTSPTRRCRSWVAQTKARTRPKHPLNDKRRGQCRDQEWPMASKHPPICTLNSPRHQSLAFSCWPSKAPRRQESFLFGAEAALRASTKTCGTATAGKTQ